MTQDDDNRWRPIIEVAAEWFVRVKDDRLSGAERREYLQWLKKSPMHIAEVLQLDRLRCVLRNALRGAHSELLLAANEGSNIIDMAAHSIVAPQPTRQPGTRHWKIAAGFAVVTLAGLLALIVKAAWFDRTIETEASEWRNVPLTDGSVVRMGPHTQLRVELRDTQRLVHLQRGEAYFEVAKDPARPFVVNAGPVKVRAVGTEFGITRRDNRVVVTVAEGVVAITRNGRVSAGERDAPRDVSVPVSAGEQVAVSQFWPVSARRINVGRELAWAEGRLIFQSGDTLAQAIDEFNRRNREQITMDDIALGSRQVRGVFYASDPETFVDLIAKDIHVAVMRDKPGLLRLVSEAR